MNTSPFEKYNDRTITVFRWVLIPFSIIGQVAMVIDKSIQDPMKLGLWGLPNIVLIASSVAFIFLMVWMFLEMSKAPTRRKNITNPQQDGDPDS